MVDDEQDEDGVVAQLLDEAIPAYGQFEIQVDAEFLDSGGTLPGRGRSARSVTRSRTAASERAQAAAPTRPMMWRRRRSLRATAVQRILARRRAPRITPSSHEPFSILATLANYG